MVKEDSAIGIRDRRVHREMRLMAKLQPLEVLVRRVNKEVPVRKVNKGTVRNAAGTATGRVDQRVPMHPNHLQREPSFVGRTTGAVPGILR